MRPQLNKDQQPEVLFAGQAFDIEPSRPPKRPEIFDLTVSAQQNYGGNRAPQNEGRLFLKYMYIHT